MESKRRISVTNGDEEDCLDSSKVSGMKLPDRGILKSILKEGRSRYAALDFEGASGIFQRAWDIALQQQASAAAMVQVANNVSACMLHQRDFQGVLHWTRRALEVSPTQCRFDIRKIQEYINYTRLIVHQVQG